MIGGAGFLGPPGQDGAVELGYDLVPEWRNRGLATEAVQALVAFAFAHDAVHRVFATTAPPNRASARVLEKAGFAFVGSDSQLARYEVRKLASR